MSEQTMVERVARALAKYTYPGASETDINELWDAWEGDARVAIATMRDPTQVMIARGADHTLSEMDEPDPETATVCWWMMIDAALSEIEA